MDILVFELNDDDATKDRNNANFLFVVLGWKNAIKSLYEVALYGVHFPLYDELIMQWVRLYPCFRLQIEIISVGICCFFSSKLYVCAENWICLPIKYCQIQNVTLKMVSHEAWLKDKYSIYFSGLQQSCVFHKTLKIINESSSNSSDSCHALPFQLSV